MSEILGDIGGAVGSAVGGVLETTVSAAADGIGGVLSSLLYSVCYGIGSGLCWIVSILDQLFSVMSGVTRIRYAGIPQTLLSVFFDNNTVTAVYWAMALIGILMCFVFAIVAVAKKAVDSDDRMKQSMGGILTGMFKGILIIICLTFLMNVVLSLSDKLLTQINYAFNHSETLGKEDSIEFKDDQYAAMARVLDTVANYSLNPSYNSRYNLNSCYNEIRQDLQYLVQQGVFDFYYVTDEQNGESWQSALQKIVNAADLDRDLSMDVYDPSVSNALLECMRTLQTDYSFAPLKSYTRQYSGYGSNVPLDRLVFLMCTTRAAKNPVYNQNVSMEDPLRGAYYTGEKSIYSYGQVSSDFEMGGIDYVVLYMVAFKLIWDLAVIMLDCVARIFNMVFLYLIAPPFIGVMPLDDGGKFRQWTTAFVVQCFGVFGTVIAMRVLLIFIPIVVNSDLVLFDSSILNLAGKLILILGGMSTAKRASGVVTGILADNAGMQAIHAGSLGDSVRQGMDHLRNRATGYGETGGWSKNGGGLRGKFSKNNGASGGSGGGRTGGRAGSGRAPGGGADRGPSPSPEMQRRADAMRQAISSGRLSLGGQPITGASEKGLQAMAELSGQSRSQRWRNARQNAARIQSLMASGDIRTGGFGGFGGGAPAGGSGGSAPSGGEAPGRAPDGGTADAGPSSGASEPVGTGDEGLDWLNAAAGASGSSGASGGPDEGLDWLPDGDVMTRDNFSPDKSGDGGLDWLPDGDVMTRAHFSAPGRASGNRTPPPPRPPVPGAVPVPEGEDPLSRMSRDRK